MKQLALPFALAALLFTGCEQPHTGSHDIKPKHGGEVIHLGDHKEVIEVLFDEKAGTLTLHTYDAHGDEKAPDSAPLCNIEASGDKKPKQVTAKGEKSKWVFTDDRLKGHPHVEFVLKFGGKTYNNDKWHAPH